MKYLLLVLAVAGTWPYYASEAPGSNPHDDAEAGMAGAERLETIREIMLTTAGECRTPARASLQEPITCQRHSMP